MSLLAEVAAGISLHAHRIVHRSAVLPQQSRRSQHGRAQPTPHRSGAGALPQAPTTEDAGGGSNAEAVALPVGVALSADESKVAADAAPAAGCGNVKDGDTAM
eukprot:jgi/Ulvmu1/10433/UM062_0029.1